MPVIPAYAVDPPETSGTGNFCEFLVATASVAAPAAFEPAATLAGGR
jgi:hypothetical protein